MLGRATLRLTKAELEALLAALDTGSAVPPVVPDLEAYYSALQKLKDADKS